MSLFSSEYSNFLDTKVTPACACACANVYACACIVSFIGLMCGMNPVTQFSFSKATKWQALNYTTHTIQVTPTVCILRVHRTYYKLKFSHFFHPQHSDCHFDTWYYSCISHFIFVSFYPYDNFQTRIVYWKWHFGLIIIGAEREGKGQIK